MYAEELTPMLTRCLDAYRDNKGGLYLGEIWELTEGNRNILDPTGWIAGKLEWFVSYYLFADDDVRLSRLASSMPVMPYPA